jgi:drug/metabolite transporter (DMT)-like permease
MAVILGLLVALSYGSGDFFGGLAAKRSPTLAVVIASYGLAAVLVLVSTVVWELLVGLPSPQPRDLWLGAASGVIAPLAIGLLYRGLATGRMSVVAPITAVVAASVPVVWGLASGERPSGIAVAGMVIALVAVGLISSAPTHEDHPSDAPVPPLRQVVPPAVASGIGFGAIFVLLGSTTADAAIWPMVVARPLAVTLTAATAVIVAARTAQHRRTLLVAPAAALPYAAAAGTLDVSANVIYMAATQRGLLSIVAVVASLYPAATVVLARVVLGERLHRVQLAGLAAATLGIIAMAS